MTVDDLRTHFKAESDAALARKLGKDRSVISYWRKGIPPKTQAALELLTKGKVKADRKQLCA